MFFGAIVNIIFLPLFFPDLVGTPGGWIVTGAATIGYMVFLIASIALELHNLILIVNVTFIGVIMSAVLLPMLVPPLVGTPAGGAWIFGVSLGWTIICFILLHFSKGEPDE